MTMNQDKSPDNLHICEGVAECPVNDDDTLKNTKQRVKDLAKIDACKKIDDYIQLFFKNKSFNLPEDEISAISTEIANVIDVKYQMQSSDNENMIIRAAVTAQFDDNDILNHLDKFFRDKSALVEQNEALRQKLTKLEKQQDKDFRKISSLTAENEALRKEIEDLKRQLANTQPNNNQSTRKLTDKEKITLANKKSDEAWKKLCESDYRGAIKLYDEAIKLNPKVDKFYFYRSRCYLKLGDEKKAKADIAKYKSLG